VIVGVGIDLVEIERIRRLLERNGDAFLGRILQADEQRGRSGTPEHVAGLFAAKEAVMKALGTGMAGAAFSEIQIWHADSGQPNVRLHGDTAERAEALGATSWHISITHNRTSAAAVAIATADDR
jgi:holo-[acyl-carrier protein] synthase